MNAQPAIAIEAAVGAVVHRHFDMGGIKRRPGDVLTSDDIADVPRANLNSLIGTGIIELVRSAVGEGGSTDPIERFSVHIGGGKYIVIEGRKLTEEPVTKEEAAALAAVPSEED